MLASALMLCFLAVPAKAADKSEIETNAPKATVETPAEAQQALRAFLQLQEQVHETMLSVEKSRKETQAAIEKSAEILAARLNGLESTVSLQRQKEAEIAGNASRFALIVALCLGSLGLIVMVLTGWFLMKTARQFSTIAAMSGSTITALTGPMPTALLTDSGSFRPGVADESGVKLLGAIERLEKRIHDIEHANPNIHGSIGDGVRPEANHSNGAPETTEAPEVALLMGKGQSLLHLDQADQAVACFDQILVLEPKNTEALVKKGAALEKLKRLEDAVECYDRAIAVDDSMTLAYLYKGGVFNQLERFGEALQCYEKALRTQQRVAVH
jgi:tetratricopeptide (TPR) repeat protein